VSFLGRLGFGPRVSGPPRSSNGASSLHLTWEVPLAEPLGEVAVTLTVPAAPTVDALYFWALQASFADGAGAHLGLQWGADAPRRMRHANWGGYAAHGGELTGTPLTRPSSFGNPNTCDLDWADGVPHRLRIARDGDGWAGFVDDVRLRSLHAGGTTLHSPVVWSEVFADCDDPTVTVRWSDLEVVTVSGDRSGVRSVRVNYQSRADGGCDNTCSRVDGDSFVQATNTERSTPQGSRLTLP
jgi:hypothetical protein